MMRLASTICLVVGAIGLPGPAVTDTASRELTQRANERHHAPRDTVVPVSSRDRVYTGDQVSNTVSVIDPSTNRLVGQIRLGSIRLTPLPGAGFTLSPLYGEQINAHGLGYSPDHRLLSVVSTATNGITIIETATNHVRGTVYVGRNPHEAFFSPDGRELWVSVRGENYVSVIDPVRMREVRRVVTAPGPSMVVFHPDGKTAFVNHSFTPELDVVDVASGRVLDRIAMASPFSPDLAITDDGEQIWATHKDVGQVSVIDVRTRRVTRVLDTGPITNHVNFAGPGGGAREGGAAAGAFAYVTVCAENAVKVYRRADLAQVATVRVGACPHGVWPSGDGTRVYVGLQQGDAVEVIDTRTNARIATIPMGQSPQALVYVSNAVPTGDGTSGLHQPGSTRQSIELPMVASAGDTTAWGRVYVRALGPVDGVDISVRRLASATTYTLWLTDSSGEPSHRGWPLATVMTDGHGGAALVESVTPAPLPRGPDASGRRLVLVRGSAAAGPVLLSAPWPG